MFLKIGRRLINLASIHEVDLDDGGDVVLAVAGPGEGLMRFRGPEDVNQE
jgi:hypothetical protein